MFLLSGVAVYLVVTQSFTYHSTIAVDTADGTDWSLWAPRGPGPVEIEASQGTFQVIGEMQTPHGAYVNISGIGDVRIQWVSRRTVYLPAPLTLEEVEEVMDESTGHRIFTSATYFWWSTSALSGGTQITGSISFEARRAMQRGYGDWEFAGTLSEGWNTVYATTAQAGLSGGGFPPFEWVSVIAFTCATAFGYGSFVAWKRTRARKAA